MFTENDEVMIYMRDSLKAAHPELVGVWTADEEFIPGFPAICIIPDPLSRRLSEVGYFEIVFTMNIMVYHANMVIGRSQRTLDDIALAKSIKATLHADKKLAGNILLPGWVQQEEIGGVVRGLASDDPETVMTTRLTWVGSTREEVAF